jgi:hypothetical protein
MAEESGGNALDMAVCWRKRENYIARRIGETV